MHRSGMSLVEVMVVALILAVALSGMFGAMGAAHTTNVHTESEVRVLQQMESIVEEIQTLPFDQVSGMDDNTYAIDGVDPQGEKDYIIEVDIVEVYTNVYSIDLSAAWSEISGPRSSTLSYIHVNRGG